MARAGPEGDAPDPLPEMTRRHLGEFERLFEVLPDGLLVVDADGRIVLVNERLQVMTAYSAGELAGQPIEVLLPARLRKAHRRDREGFIADPRARMAAGRDFSMRRKDGRELPVDVALSPLKIDGDLHVICVVRDTSERRQAEERLREAEARYRSIFENAIEGIFRTTLDGRYEEANPALAQMLGYSSPEELMADVTDVGQLYVEVGGREDFTRRIDEQGFLTEYEYQVRRKGGGTIWVSEKVRALRDPDGRPSGFEGTGVDVTERKRAEESSRKRDAILDAVAFSAERFLREGAWHERIDEVLERLGVAAGARRVTIFRNDRDEAGHGRSSVVRQWAAPEIGPQIGEPHFQDFPHLGGSLERWPQVLGAGGLIYGRTSEFPEVERQVLEAQGILSIVIAPVFARSEWWGALSFADCLTERAWEPVEIDALKTAASTLGAAVERGRVEDSLRKAEARYRTLVEQIPAIVYLAEFGADGRWVFVSPQIEQILGYTAEEWMADPAPVAFFTHADDLERVLSEEAHSRATGEPFRSEYRVRTPDDRWVWVRDEAVVVRDEAGDALFLQGLMHDITERKRAEEELQARAREQAALADLGQRALVGTDLPLLLDHAVTLVAETLDVEYAKVFELLPGEQELLLRTGVGWREGFVGRATVPAGPGSQAGYTLQSDEPVVVEDLSTESRFSAPALLQEHEVVSGVTVIIRGRARPFGVFGVDTGRRRTFEPDSVNFLQSVANVLGEAIERGRVQEELRENLDLLRKTDAERRRLVAHLVNAQEEERARIASDIHDDPLQKITALGLRVSMLKRELEDPKQRERIEEIERTVSLTADSLRHLLFEVRPLALDREGLAAALREYLDQAAADAGFTFALEDGLVSEPAPEIRALCYRIAQEALSNVKVHARADRVEVSLASQEAGVRVRIRDDGVGFAPDSLTAAPGHLGLHDMRERAELTGGWLRIDSSPGRGTSVEFWVPSGLKG